jgi:type VI secretion system protein ImpL
MNSGRTAAVAASILAGSVVATYWIERLVHPTGKTLWILRTALPALGALAALLFAWYARRSERAANGAAAPAPAVDEITPRFRDAQKHLRTATFETPRRKIAALPVAVLLGPAGSGKTSAVTRSALATELLAGDTFRGDAIVSTESVNIWYSDGTLLVEAGGAATGDADAWKKIVKQIRKRWLSASLRYGATAPRVAVVTLSCEMLLANNGAEQALQTARELRSRLQALSKAFGLRLPVYVLLTRMDAIPGATAFLKTCSDDEIGDVMGVSLPITTPTSAATWADETFRRLEREVQSLVTSTAEYRLEVLARDRTAEFAAEAFQFPRELRRTLDAAVPAMLELCRPSQLEVSPFLRGFYLTGTRVVALDSTEVARNFATETAPSIMDGVSAQDDEGPLIRWDDESPAPISPRNGVQTVFLDNVWQRIILRDETARAISQSGVQSSRFRRAMAASVLLAAGVASVGFTTSYAANKNLRERVLRTASAAVTALPGEASLPGLDVLQRVDSLRNEVKLLRTWTDSGAPTRYRWGLFTGASLLHDSRQAYFGTLEHLALGETRQRMLTALQGMPTARGTDYGSAYRLLKAHLITNSRPDRSTPEFLTPVLEEYWFPSGTLEPERRGLVREQFDFYATELPRGNPYGAGDDPAAVQASRAWLEQFTGAAPIYEAIIADVSARVMPVRLATTVPGSVGVVNDAYTVPGAFTRAGGQQMAEALTNVSRYYDVEEWVLGKRTLVRSQKDSLVSELRTRYKAQLREHWLVFLRAAGVSPFANARDASTKLRSLSSNASPLLGVLAMTSQNTGSGPFGPDAVFQPAHVVTPPTLTDRFIDKANAEYAQALLSLQAAMEQVAVAPSGQGESQAQNALSSVAQVRTAAGALAQAFQVDESRANVDATVRKLLEQPANYAARLLGRVGAGETNASGPQLCTQFGKLAGRAPFDGSWTSPANIADVTAFFHPKDGFLASFRSDVLEQLLVRQGSTWTARPGAATRVSSGFLGFFNRALSIGDALYPDGATDPTVRFSFRPVLSTEVPQVTLSLDGRVATWTRTSTASQTFVWNGSSAQSAKLSVTLADGSKHDVGAFDGPWSLFALFGMAANWAPAGGSWRAEWRNTALGTGVDLPFEISTSTGAPVFRRGYFNSMRCTNRLVD